jgi:hypothetical protein
MESDPLVVVVAQARGHIRSRSPLKDSREKPTPDKADDRRTWCSEVGFERNQGRSKNLKRGSASKAERLRDSRESA